MLKSNTDDAERMARTARRPVVDFGVAAAKILRESLVEGLDFETAWARVTGTIRPSDTSWGRLDRSEESGGETPMQHCYRVMREAYESRGGNGCHP